MAQLHIIDGGPAFPDPAHVRGYADGLGMSLRDYFAGQVIASIRSWHPADRNGRNPAVIAYEIADAMIAARGEQPS